MKLVISLYDFINASFRLLWLGIHFAYGLMLLVVYRFRWGPQWFYTEAGAKSVQKWFRQGCRILDLNIQLSGTAYSGSAIVVANHISWLDIAAIAASTPVTFVSKMDLKHWPIVGVLAKFSGTVFIKRGSLFSMHQTFSMLVDVLSAGQKTVFFPEGTTTTGIAVDKFHSGLFQTALSSNRPVQPVAISYYRDSEADRDIAPYVDDDHFLKHLWILLLKRKLHVQIDFLDEITSENRDRREIADLCHSRISEVIATSAMINDDYPLEVKDAGFVLLS